MRSWLNALRISKPRHFLYLLRFSTRWVRRRRRRRREEEQVDFYHDTTLASVLKTREFCSFIEVECPFGGLRRWNAKKREGGDSKASCHCQVLAP
jgi:hypothetical protein